MDYVILTKAGSILGPIATLFGYIMDMLFKFTSSFGVFNIGLCIILFTILVKLLMFPMTISQQKSSRLMSMITPEVQAIQKKYKGKKDQDSMMRQNAEVSAVYEKYGASPTGGCLQVLIQFPIILALYRVIYNIPAYVPSVRVFFDNVVEPLQQQPDYINKIAALAQANGLSIDKVDYSIADKCVDLLYKFTPAQWDTLEGLFPAISDVIAKNAAEIEQMNQFFGINLSTPPFTGFANISIAWLIPILAGLTQWISTRLMSANQKIDPDSPGAQSMKTMMYMMPIMSVGFCFGFPAGIGIYWIMTAVVQIVQQLIVNSYMDKIDMDELIKKNVEKMNKKRAKKGLPPAKVTQNASASLKNLKSEQEHEDKIREEKLEQTKKQIKDSSAYYNADAKPGSLAAKANMVQKYNEKHK